MSYTDPDSLTVAGTTCSGCDTAFCYNAATGREPRYCRQCARRTRP
jgi:formamidopyrimidine-DNA glycosylase